MTDAELARLLAELGGQNASRDSMRAPVLASRPPATSRITNALLLWAGLDRRLLRSTSERQLYLSHASVLLLCLCVTTFGAGSVIHAGGAPPVLAFGLGLVLASATYLLDRALLGLAAFRPYRWRYKQATRLLLRAALAFFIATVVSFGALAQVSQPQLEQAAATHHEVVIAQARDAVDHGPLAQTVTSLRDQVALANERYDAEVQGSGTTGVAGAGPRAQQLAQQIAEAKFALQSAEEALAAQKEQAASAASLEPNNLLLLMSLTQENSAVKLTYLALLTLVFLVSLLPVLVLAAHHRSTYAALVRMEKQLLTEEQLARLRADRMSVIGGIDDIVVLRAALAEELKVTREEATEAALQDVADLRGFRRLS